MRRFLLFLSFLTAFFCFGQAPVRAADMTVSAAASLTNAFTELKSLFEKNHAGVTVYTNYAASNPLLKQMQEGAPVDVFASADQETMNKAEAAGLLRSGSRKNFVRNTLVLIVPKNHPRPAKLEDVTAMKRIAVGDPKSVPAGRYAKDALSHAGLWEKLSSTLVFGNNVRQVLDYVARGEVEAGIVYGTDAKVRKDKVDVAMELTGHAPILYPIAVCTTGSNPKDGQAFVDFVFSAEGMKVLRAYGFEQPE